MAGNNMYSDNIPEAVNVVTYSVAVIDESTNKSIVGATVTWEINGVSSQQIGRNGFALYKTDEDSAPDVVYCSISASGYESQQHISIPKGGNVDVKLKLKENVYPFSIQDTGGAILSDVLVEISPDGITETTPTKYLNYIYSSNTGGTRKFRFTKNGYKNITSGLDPEGYITKSLSLIHI